MFGAGSGNQPDGEGLNSAEAAADAGSPDRDAGGKRTGSPSPADSGAGPRPWGVAHAVRVIGIGAAAIAVVAGGAVYALTQHTGSTAARAAAAPRNQVVSGPIRIYSVTPASGATGVNGAAPLVVSFSAPLAADSPYPQLKPSVPGSWSTQGNAMVFTPASTFAQSSRVTVQIPGGPAGVRSTSGALLTASITEHFTVGAYSQARLAQLLAQLGYLPMTWSAVNNGAVRAASSSANLASTPEGEAFDPPGGTFRWKPGYPWTLRSLWSATQPNVILRGAVMAFQSQHGMTINGALTPKLWQALFTADQLGQRNQSGYTYAIASKRLPETLTIWHDGRVVLRSPTNTGIPVSPTVDGTFPVYLRFRFTIMSGTNPDGSHYSDPVSFVSYFNGGDAVHYFPRGSYGFQQSLGCVELPYTAAERAYPYLTYGSLVSVTG
ncbi:MAG: Ig-like domain-containing protein [Streptosporangiaceae bacterium]